MKDTCKFCGSQFDRKRLGYKNHQPLYKKYCNHQCANKALTRLKTEDEKEQIRQTVLHRIEQKGMWGAMILEKRGGRKKFVGTLEWFTQLQSQSFNSLKWDYKRALVIFEQKGKCAKCDIENWLGKKLNLHIDHKDGDRSNDKRKNLEGLCPNCHSLTSTYCGKNKTRGKFPIAEVFYNLYQQHGTIRKALIACNMTPKGGNYETAKRIIAAYL